MACVIGRENEFKDNFFKTIEYAKILNCPNIHIMAGINVDKILEDKLEFKEQAHEEATYAYKIEKSEGKIDWNNSAESIIGKINGLYPNPGAWFIYNGERYKVLKAEISNGTGKTGTVLNDYLEVSCYNKSVKILEIQREGKRPQNINEFMLGSQIKKGTNLNNA